MATITDPQREGFRLSQLIYDTRYRSMTIQVVALIGFMLFAAWLITNTAENLATQGKDLSFAFFWEPASYDINQRLIEYDSRDTHLRAAVVGLLNTLLVAVLGCITATIIGVLVGVARLSPNWLLARLMTVYVEMFRNVPVLLWIVLVLAVLIEGLPSPRDFRGDDSEKSMMLWESVAITNRGVYVPGLEFNGGGWLVVAVFLASLGAIWWWRRRADRVQEETGVRPPVLWPALAMFFLPVILAWFLFTMLNEADRVHFAAPGSSSAATLAEFEEGTICAAPARVRDVVYAVERRGLNLDVVNVEGAETCTLYAGTDANLAEIAPDSTRLETSLGRPAIGLKRPYLQGFNFSEGIHLRNSLIALWFALSLYTAAFIAEIVRAGILAISRGQTEAAGALGLRPNRIMSLVILPQALRVIIPPLISNYLNLTKNSSLAIAVGYMDITGTLGGITMNQTGRELECVLLLMLVYLTISLSISAVMNWYNNRVKLVER